MKILIHFVLVAFLLAASTVVQAQAYQCNKFRNSLGQCKSCGEAPFLSPLRVLDGVGCIACGGYCSKLAPLVLPGSDAAKDGVAVVVTRANEEQLKDPVCRPDFSASAPDGFHVIALDASTLRAVAALSPSAANVLVAFRDRSPMPPLVLDGGDLSSPAIPTLRSVLRHFSAPGDTASIMKAAAPLDAGQYYQSRFHIETLADDRTILVVESSILRDDGRKVRQAAETFAVELVAREGVTRPVAQVDGGTAQLYDIASFGPLATF